MNKVNWKNGVLFVGLVVGLLAIDFRAIAQDTEITDEDLQNYAVVMQKVDEMKVDLKAKTSELVKGNELMDGGRRFNAIKGAGEDEAKLTELEVTEEELAAFNEINESIAGMKAEFKTNYTAVIKDNLGVGTFNKVKKALKADADLKTKYESIVASLDQTEDTESEETSGDN